MGSLWESFILSVQVCACERAESDGGICIAAKEPTIGTTWRSLCLFYREHRIKTLRSAAGKYGPPLLKREMSNRWLAPCPPVPLMLRAPGRKLTQLLWPKPDTHTHTHTNHRGSIAAGTGRDWSWPKKAAAVYSEEWGDAARVHWR